MCVRVLLLPADRPDLAPLAPRAGLARRPYPTHEWSVSYGHAGIQREIPTAPCRDPPTGESCAGWLLRTVLTVLKEVITF